MSKLLNYVLSGIPSLLFLLSTPAVANLDSLAGGISLSQTRVLFLSTDKDRLLTVKNTSELRYLIQTRVQMSPTDTTVAPFIVTPPLFTLQPDSRQLLRILPRDAALPVDRESLFTLSVLAIPAQETDAPITARVSMGLRFTLKLFYRPATLVNGAATCSLQFRTSPGGVLVDNPTPYFQTFGQLSLNGKRVNLNAQTSMLAPNSTQHYSAIEPVRLATWQTLTDEGVPTILCRQGMLTTQEK